VLRTAVLAAFDPALSFSDGDRIDRDEFDSCPRQEFVAVEAALECPRFLMLIVPE
jgi:hypothetical protein